MKNDLFARKIYGLRRRLGKTRAQIAERANIPEMTIWRWEQGECEPHYGFIKYLAKALEVKPSELVKYLSQTREIARILGGKYD